MLLYYLVKNIFLLNLNPMLPAVNMKDLKIITKLPISIILLKGLEEVNKKFTKLVFLIKDYVNNRKLLQIYPK